MEGHIQEEVVVVVIGERICFYGEGARGGRICPPYNECLHLGVEFFISFFFNFINLEILCSRLPAYSFFLSSALSFSFGGVEKRKI